MKFSAESTDPSSEVSRNVGDAHLAQLRETIEHAAHYLPSQGPITVFVHHNNLHSFEHLPFEQGVVEGGRLYGCNAFLPEERYRQKLARGRIRREDLEAVLSVELSGDDEKSVGALCSQAELRLALLEVPLRSGTRAELSWLVSGTNALRSFANEVNSETRSQIVEQTRHWVMRDLKTQESGSSLIQKDVLDEALSEFDLSDAEIWAEGKWEELTIYLLWKIVRTRVGGCTWDRSERTSPPKVRHRDVLLKATGDDSDLLINDTLVRFWSAYLDQGFANWAFSEREKGPFLRFLELASCERSSPTLFSKCVAAEAKRLLDDRVSAEQAIEESLHILGVDESEEESFIIETLLAFRGWAGMVWQMETNAPWEPHPAPKGALVQYLAVRLLLERVALRIVVDRNLDSSLPLDLLREAIDEGPESKPEFSADQMAFAIFELAQHRGWGPERMAQLRRSDFESLIGGIRRFDSLARRKVYHLAFERKYRNETLDAVLHHAQRLRGQGAKKQKKRKLASYQVVCCIDEREESFRRHLEEVDPESETFGVAGFFGVAMYYRGVEEAHFRPLCPVNITPQHYIVEDPSYSVQHSESLRVGLRRRLGKATHRAHRGNRTFMGGILSGLLGAIAVFPLVARILFPRSTAQFRRFFGRMVKTPATELRLEQSDCNAGRSEERHGYSVEEMAQIVEGGLRAIGLTQSEQFTSLVVICGHGSASLNNPQEAAHDCGACGGGRGGPNARAFSQMANDPRVRTILASQGIPVPAESLFVGVYHNTCDDSMTWYDLERIPRSHRTVFERVRDAIDEARARSAHERCRRFHSADLEISVLDALRHVEGRAEDLSQPRPEYGHCTNALCFVGRRSWSRGLFLDRRAFLTSYDPTQDDEASSILERLLQAVIPVCAGINLEYYFSYVDPTGYGCGTKLPHNITSLLGVMDGAASDLRPGLPWQMVELHEPVRLLFVIETSPSAIERIISENEAIARLVNGNWVQLAIFDADALKILRYVDGKFVTYDPETSGIPLVRSSVDWYRGWRDHLGFASIGEQFVPTGSEG